MEENAQPVYTRAQYEALNDEQRLALSLVRLGVIDGQTMQSWDDDDFSETFNLLRPNEDGCVPNEEADRDYGVLDAVREKFACITCAACELAAAIVGKPNPFQLLVDPSLDGYTYVAVIDPDERNLHLYYARNDKAWHVEYPDLASIANEVLAERDEILSGWRRAHSTPSHVSIATPTGRLTAELQADPEYPGLIILRGNRQIAVIENNAPYEEVIKPRIHVWADNYGNDPDLTIHINPGFGENEPFRAVDL